MIIFTDGSAKKKNKNRYGGIGVFFEGNISANISKSYIGQTVTNQRMELEACIQGVTKCLEIDNQANIHVYSDSLYVINSMTKWAKNWEKNNWKDVCNIDLQQQLYKLYLDHKIEFSHVRSHQLQPDKSSANWSIWFGNNQADILARQAMRKVEKAKE